MGGPHPCCQLYTPRYQNFSQAAYDLVLEPILSTFDPQLVIIGAGFDAVEGDTLGNCHMTPDGYAHLTQRLMRLAGGRVVAVLEGGYETRWALLLFECWQGLGV